MNHLLASALIALAALLASCTQTDSGSAPTGGSGEGLRDPALHALMAQRIDGLYRRIEVLAFDQNRTQPELDLARQRVAGEITNDATALSAYAAELSAIGTTLELSAVERQEFLGLAGDLQEASENLILATSEGSSQNLTDAIYTLRETCAACHSLYRGR